MFAFGIKYIFAEILKFAFVLDIELSTFAQSILGFPLKSQNNTRFKDVHFLSGSIRSVRRAGRDLSRPPQQSMMSLNASLKIQSTDPCTINW